MTHWKLIISKHIQFGLSIEYDNSFELIIINIPFLRFNISTNITAYGIKWETNNEM